MSTLNVDKVDPNTGTALEIGSSGDTVTVPSGATLTLTSATLNLPTTITSTTEVKTNKISPATGVAFALGDSGDTFTVPSGATIVNSGTATGFGITQTSFLPTANPLIINGDMAISQRSTSVTGITGNGMTTVDRMSNSVSGIGTYTVAQEALTSGAAYTDGFSTAYRIDCTTADASPAAADYLYMQYNMEGQNLQVFKKGTANAETFTIAFWVKSNKTGVGSIELKDKNNSNRQCTQSYTISVADTWEKKICAFGADTTGAFANANTKSLNVNWWLGSGTNYSSGTANNGTWEASAATKVNADGTLDINDNTANDWAITAIQLEVGTYTSADLPPFRHESYGDNLLRCQRYYQQNYRDGLYPGDSTTDGGSWTGALYGTDFLTTFTPWTVRMRTNPTITWYTRTGTEGSWYAGVYQVSEAVDTMTTAINTPTGWNGTVSNVAANTDLAYGYYSSDAEL